ncbi:hypothetical protein MPH_03726 [Macrophomina phaseolina MS6]|uniref:Uncharacterized protein n=1 Tax=Macrophomina phaseolina (strain MS6) TaxID=1126212 RepID=K2R9A2_MACPH|nr:hypothetical protein MPH_03726 [Macrophomina phaseolina MS6]
MDRSHVYGVELSRLRNLSRLHVPLRKIHFRLESDTLPVRDSYIDLYIPQFHRYDPGGDSSIRHLDVTTTWRGLSVSHAEELKFWEEMFAAVLEYTISNYLIEAIDSMDDCNIDRYPGDLDSRICSFANKLGSKTLPVNIREINSCMMQLHQRHGPQYQWLACTGNLHNTLCEFLRTRECFLDTPLDPSVQVTFSACLSGQGEPNIVGTLQRYGPSLRFHRLDTSTNDGAWCSIHPSYVEQVLNPAYPSFLGRPEYHLTSDWIKFNWEGDHEGFLGYPAREEGSESEYMVIQPTHTNSSLQNLSLSNTPLEMKRLFRTEPKTPRHAIVHYHGASCSPKAANTSPVCPASAPTLARKNIDLVHPSRDSKRPSSAARASMDNSARKTSGSSSDTAGLFPTAVGSWQYESCPAWVAWQKKDPNSEPSGLQELAPEWYGPPPDMDVRVEKLRAQMKEWYDAMILKRDTPRKKSQGERSEEQAYIKLFIGGSSGDEGDVE